MYFRFLCTSLCLVALLFSKNVRAADPAAAEALFRSALEAAERGDWITACDRFEESKRLEPAPGTVLNLARCREKLGQVASAWKSYEEAAQRLPAGDRRATFARARAVELSSRVPHLVLTPPETDSEFEVKVSGTRLSSASFGVPLPYDPGNLEIVVTAADHEDFVSRIEMVEGETATFELQLGPEIPTVEEPADAGEQVRPQDTAAGGKSRTWGKVSLAVGGVGAAVAIVGAIWASLELSIVKDHCQDRRCDETGMDAAARGRVSVALLGAGSAVTLLGVGVGSYLLLKPAPKTKIGFSPLPGGGMLNVRHSL